MRAMASAPAIATPFGWKRQLRVKTQDDVTLCVERVGPEGDCKGAVVLCHGLSANGLAFDLPGRSLARFLAEQGYECFIPDLRGARHSTQPKGGWCIDDYIEQDLPAVLDLVREQALKGPIHWLGHSLGGLLFVMYASEHPETFVQRVITVASGLNYSQGDSVYHGLRKALPWARPLRKLPMGIANQVASRFSKYVHLPIENMKFYRPNVEAEVIQTLMSEGFGPVPTALLADLNTSFEAGGLARCKGTFPYADLWPLYRFPTLMLAGSKDAQCPVEAVDGSARMISHLDELSVLAFGREHGHYEDYGHFDLLVGRHAPTEVWPHLVEWLDASI